MSEPVDPKSLGLHPSTRIEKSGDNSFTLVINRKSRIIMKDGRGILARAEQIRTRAANASVCVRTTAPVCSKTRAFLEEHNIPIRQVPPDPE